MKRVTVKLSEGGTIAIPEEYLAVLEWSAGDDVVLDLEGEEIRMFNLGRAVRRAQEIVRRHVPEGHSLSDELIAERRAEAERE